MVESPTTWLRFLTPLFVQPTVNSSATTFAEFSQLPQNVTIGQIQEFVESSFKGEGLEIVPVSIQGFVDQPEVLDEVEDQIYKGWVSIVNGYWSLLIRYVSSRVCQSSRCELTESLCEPILDDRETNSSALCAEGEGGCDSSLIPLNHTIVVPGGRYREVYYWVSLSPLARLPL
jgi:alpha,alpha-trehalase